jgi:hypothetical protein
MKFVIVQKTDSKNMPERNVRKLHFELLFHNILKVWNVISKLNLKIIIVF